MKDEFSRKSLLAKHKRKVGRIVAIAVTVIILFAIMFPILWMIPGAFKDKTELWDIPAHWLPNEFTWDNFKKVFEVTSEINFAKSLLSTFAVASVATVLSLFVNTMAAYVFARIEFPFKKILWVLYLFPMFVPGITILLTSLKVVNSMHLSNTFWVLVLPGLASAYQTFFFRQFFLGVPSVYEEAAELDGCNKIQIFFRVFLPMSITPLIIQGFNIFIGYWNSFMWPALTVTGNTDLAQVMQTIYAFQNRYPNNFGIVIAASLVAMIIPTAIFSIAQKKIVQGITLSGIK